ncbi:Uncharacterised protein [Mycobacterium tuberculosis]|nr:Uncharacterised protein [Mycobacterium tuberculosis]
MRVANEVGPPGDDREKPRTKMPGQKQRRHRGQPVQGKAQMHLSGGFAVADSQRRSHLRGRAVPEVTRPVGPLVRAGAPAGQLGDRRQPPGARSRLHTSAVLDRGHQRAIIGSAQLRRVRQRYLEHVCDTSSGHRQHDGSRHGSSEKPRWVRCGERRFEQCPGHHLRTLALTTSHRQCWRRRSAELRRIWRTPRLRVGDRNTIFLPYASTVPAQPGYRGVVGGAQCRL